MTLILQATESIPPDVIRRIAKEIKDLSASPLEGIKVVFNEEDITDVQASIEGPGTLCYYHESFKTSIF